MRTGVQLFLLKIKNSYFLQRFLITFINEMSRIYLFCVFKNLAFNERSVGDLCVSKCETFIFCDFVLFIKKKNIKKLMAADGTFWMCIYERENIFS